MCELTTFCVRLLSSGARKGREAMAEFARIEGQKAFERGDLDPDRSTLAFAEFVHKRLGVPQGDFCYSFTDFPEFAPVARAVNWFDREYRKGEVYALNHL